MSILHRFRPVTVMALGLTLALGCKARNTGTSSTESAVALPDDSSSASVSGRDHRSVAEKVVAQSAGVKSGDLVLIFGSDEDLPLLEDVAVEVRKRGASPLISVGSEGLSRRLYDEVPAEYDSQTPAPGTATVSVGDNTWAGGHNQVKFGLPAYSPGSTVTVDGKPLVQDGKLLIAEAVSNR